MRHKFYKCEGGLDLNTSTLTVAPNSLQEGFNYYESSQGYTRIPGYEAFDGQPAPSLATYFYLTIDSWNLKDTGFNLAYGDTLSVDTVDFKCLKILDNTVSINIIAELITGDVEALQDSLPVTVSGAAELSDVLERGAEDEIKDSEYLWIAQNERRKVIIPVPGVGPIRGIAQLLDDKLTFRDDLSGNLTAYKSSSTGWVPVLFPQIVSVSLTGSVPKIGDTVDSNTITGVFDYTPDGSNQPDNTKRVLLTTGSLLAVNDTLTGVGTVIEIIPFTFNGGGIVEGYRWNFYASKTFYRLYISDTVNPAMEYIPQYNVINPILTNYRKPELDVPCVAVIAHSNRLFMANGGGTFITSVQGEPATIDGYLGSQEVGIGDEITGFKKTGADLLLIYTKRTTYAIKGNDPANWNAFPVSEDSGAFPNSIQSMDDVFALDDRGISSLKRSDILGGFNASTVSDNILPLLSPIKTTVTCSTVIKQLNQIRWYFSDGSFITMSRIPFTNNNGSGIRYSFTEGFYPQPVLCVSQGEDAEGKEHVYFGSSDGFIYEMDKGTSFNGEAIFSRLTLQFNHLGKPNFNKKFRRVSFNIRAGSRTDLMLFTLINFGKKELNARNIFAYGGRGGYDKARYDIAVYDAFPLITVYKKLGIDGHNIQFSLEHNDPYTAPFTITGYTLNYSIRRRVTHK